MYCWPPAPCCSIRLCAACPIADAVSQSQLSEEVGQFRPAAGLADHELFRRPRPMEQLAKKVRASLGLFKTQPKFPCGVDGVVAMSSRPPCRSSWMKPAPLGSTSPLAPAHLDHLHGSSHLRAGRNACRDVVTADPRLHHHRARFLLRRYAALSLGAASAPGVSDLRRGEINALLGAARRLFRSFLEPRKPFLERVIQQSLHPILQQHHDQALE